MSNCFKFDEESKKILNQAQTFDINGVKYSRITDSNMSQYNQGMLRFSA